MLSYKDIHDAHEALRNEACDRQVQLFAVVQPPADGKIQTIEQLVAVVLGGLATISHNHAMAVADANVLLALACARPDEDDEDDDEGDDSEGDKDDEGGEPEPEPEPEPVEPTPEPEPIDGFTYTTPHSQTVIPKTPDQPVEPRPDPSPRRRRRRTAALPVEVAGTSAAAPRDESPLRHSVLASNGQCNCPVAVINGEVVVPGATLRQATFIEEIFG